LRLTAIEKRRGPLVTRLAHHSFLTNYCIVEWVRIDARGSPPAPCEEDNSSLFSIPPMTRYELNALQTRMSAVGPTRPSGHVAFAPRGQIVRLGHHTLS
jgi:hypothetical protein